MGDLFGQDFFHVCFIFIIGHTLTIPLVTNSLKQNKKNVLVPFI